MWKPSRAALLTQGVILLALGTLLLLGCERKKPPNPPSKSSPSTPTLRIYALAGAAGAVEPCGCVKDMLGGVDHAAAFLSAQEKKAPEALVLGAGPMFFSDPTIETNSHEQAFFKAEAMASSLKDVALVAWAPGANDWALGVKSFSELSGVSGARPLAANLSESAGSVRSTLIVDAGGMKVGLAGVSVPSFTTGKVPFPVADASSSLRRARKGLLKKGAEITIALISAQRGEALRLIEAVPGFQVAILGKAYDQGDANDAPYSPEVLNGTLVVQATNHLQGISVVDLYVRNGSYSFADGSGLDLLSRQRSLQTSTSELRSRIASWSKEKSGVSEKDLSAQKKRLSGLEAELSAIKRPALPKSGSYFIYDLVEIREDTGDHAGVASRLAAYYRKVNDHNKVAFAKKLPKPAAEGQASYLGVDACSACHQEARAVWDKTQHASAYATLVSDHKEYNLDCVSCHVTGYEKPGGSTVAHVDKLSSVQCEVCHGAGSRHAADPAKKGLIRLSPDKSLCASRCHHSPHVGDSWSVDSAWPQILGKGHGIPQEQ